MTEERCVSSCTGDLFNRDCLHFTFMVFVSLGLLVFALVQLVRADFDSCHSGYYAGVITTVFSYWASPPKPPKRKNVMAQAGMEDRPIHPPV